MLGTETAASARASLPRALPGWEGERGRFARAFAQSRFVLYSQQVEKLRAGGDERPRTEIYVRLEEEEQNVVPPGTFLARLEHYQLGPTLDEYVVRRALTWHRNNRQGTGVFTLHINLCPGTLTDLEFPSVVITELKRAGCSGDCLCFEIPHDGPSEPVAHEFAKRLKAAGCGIAVGADHPAGITFRPSRDFSADFMKFGGSLIRAVTSDIGAAARLRAFIVACRTFGIQTVAQDVEDRATLTVLSALGFDYVQGYEISRPAPMEAN